MKELDSKLYVVHFHKARRKHYDLRLEMNGVLKSWAIPKKPPKRKGVKRLAIEVEDHSLSYATFEGTIPKGHYGAGTVEIWDKGTYSLEKRDKNKIVVHINGDKLTGRYCLIRFKGKNWLFFKC